MSYVSSLWWVRNPSSTHPCRQKGHHSNYSTLQQPHKDFAYQLSLQTNQVFASMDSHKLYGFIWGFNIHGFLLLSLGTKELKLHLPSICAVFVS